MKLTLLALARGVFARRLRCPYCGSRNARPSREAYSRKLADALGLVPWRCRACFRHFAFAPESGADTDSRRARRCPRCGRTNVAHSSQQDGGFADRVLARDSVRCLDCRHRFRAVDRRQAAGNLLIAATLLLAAGLGLLAFSRTSGARAPVKASRPGPVTPPAVR